MPGKAKSQKFMLNTATVMIGAVEDLHLLNPATHSIGLVKNFTLTSEPSYTELGQGVKNEIVFSVMTDNPVRASMEAYEYTAQNLAYGLGLADADSFSTMTVATAVNGAIDGDASPAPTDLVVDSATGITIGKYIMIKRDAEDDFLIRKVTNVVSTTITVDVALPDIPDNSVVLVVNKLDVGSKDDQPFYSAKINGKLADGSVVSILIPKIRIVKGFSLAFTNQDFGNLPFEMTVYSLVDSDPHFAEFAGAQARIFIQ